MTPKWFKIRTYSIIRDSSLFFNIKSQARYILTVQRTTSSLYHPLTLPPHSTDDQTEACTTFSWLLISCLLNIASCLASNKHF